MPVFVLIVYCCVFSHCHGATEPGMPIFLDAVPIETLFHRRLPVDDGCRQPTHLPSTRTTWSIFVHDSTPLTDAIMQLKRNLRHPLLPFIGWMFNYPGPVKCPIFEWLGISVHMLQQQVSIIYERSLYIQTQGFETQCLCHEWSCYTTQILYFYINSLSEILTIFTDLHSTKNRRSLTLQDVWRQFFLLLLILQLYFNLNNFW